MAFLTSDRYGAQWQGDLFVGSLKFGYLDRIELADGKVRGEEKLLQGAERAYRRYVEAVAVVEAASLIAANTGFDAQTRRERQASEEVQQAGAREAEAVELLAGTRAEIGELEGRKSAAEEKKQTRSTQR